MEAHHQARMSRIIELLSEVGISAINEKTQDKLSFTYRGVGTSIDLKSTFGRFKSLQGGVITLHLDHPHILSSGTAYYDWANEPIGGSKDSTKYDFESAAKQIIRILLESNKLEPAKRLLVKILAGLDIESEICGDIVKVKKPPTEQRLRIRFSFSSR